MQFRAPTKSLALSNNEGRASASWSRPPATTGSSARGQHGRLILLAVPPPEASGTPPLALNGRFAGAGGAPRRLILALQIANATMGTPAVLAVPAGPCLPVVSQHHQFRGHMAG